MKLMKALVLSLTCLLCACSQLALETTKNIMTVDYFADNGSGNSLAIVQHPAGVHHNGVTYVSYQGPETHPLVAAYNHDTEVWTGPFRAGTSDLAELFHQKGRIDSHGKPTMLIDDLGYIHLFYGGHGAGAKYGKNPYGRGGLGRNKHAISKRPYDISEWEDLDNISIFGTYNQAIKMDNGDIYLFYRHGAHRSDWTYQKSTDHGRTFDAAIPFIKTKPRADGISADSWYIWASKGHGDDIILSYDYHVCWFRGEGPKGRGHVTQRHDVYYMVLNTKTGQLRNIHDQPLPFPVTKEIADKQTLVARTGNDWTFNSSAHLDQNGFPHISLNIGKDLGTNTGGPKQTHYIRWTGEQWTKATVVNELSKKDNTDTRGDFVLTSNKASFWLGYKDNNEAVIATFSSIDNGKTFTKQKELLRRPNASWALTARLENAHPDAQILVAEKQPGIKSHKLYLVGENGPITRQMTGKIRY